MCFYHSRNLTLNPVLCTTRFWPEPLRTASCLKDVSKTFVKAHHLGVVILNGEFKAPYSVRYFSPSSRYEIYLLFSDHQLCGLVVESKDGQRVQASEAPGKMQEQLVSHCD